MRMSATDLDAFRYWRDNEDADLGALVSQLRRELPPTEPMLAGTAFHKALELAPYEDATDTLTADAPSRPTAACTITNSGRFFMAMSTASPLRMPLDAKPAATRSIV